MKYLVVALICTIFISLFAPSTYAQASTTREGVVNAIEVQEMRPTQDGTEQLYQKLIIELTSGERKGDSVIVENGIFPFAHVETYSIGDRVVLQVSELPDGTTSHMITDYVRRPALLWLFLLFVGVVIAVGRKWGVASLVGMAVSFLVIIYFLLPQILAGTAPSVAAIVSALIIVPATFYLSHGLNPKTHIAIIGTLLTLSLTGMIASIMLDVAHFTGYASEESGILAAQQSGEINLRGLLLAGIIIGALGVLDDITVSQASIVLQLKKANKKFGYSQLYNRAMAVGRDHIASLVNTLVLVYTGASLPLLLLFVNNPRPFTEIINYEFVSDEIVRMLVGSIGLVLAVPITTAIASFVFSRKN